MPFILKFTGNVIQFDFACSNDVQEEKKAITTPNLNVIKSMDANIQLPYSNGDILCKAILLNQ